MEPLGQLTKMAKATKFALVISITSTKLNGGLLSKTKLKKKHRKQWLIHFLVLQVFMPVTASRAKSGKCIAQSATTTGAVVVAVVATMDYCNENKTNLMSYCKS